MVAQTDLETLYAQSRNRPEACSPVEAAPRQHPDLPTLDPRRCPTAAELDFTQPLRALRRFVDEGALPGRRFNVRLGVNRVDFAMSAIGPLTLQHRTCCLAIDSLVVSVIQAKSFTELVECWQ